MHNPSPTSTATGTAPHAGPDAPDFDLVGRTVAELDEAVRERERVDRAYREAFASFEATGEDKAEADAAEADARPTLLALCFDVVRRQAAPDKRLSRFLLCQDDGVGERLVLDTGPEEEPLRRERDRIMADQPRRELYVVHEEYVRVASTVRRDGARPD